MSRSPERPHPAGGREPLAVREVKSTAAATFSEPGKLLPALTPAGREVLEVLWTRNAPQSTRALHDAVSRCFPERAGRQINTTSTLLTELVEQGWVAGRKRGGSRWHYEPAVSRSDGMTALAQRTVGEFCADRRDAWYLVREALRALDLEELVQSGRSRTVPAPGFGPGPGGRRSRRG